jgi:ketosteroid isomerase-like protein
MQPRTGVFAFTLTTVSLAILSAGPAAAQHLTDQDGRQIVEGIEKVKAKAFEAKDAAIWGSLFADNAVELPLSGETSVGRPAIENWFGGMMKSWEADPNKLVEVKVVNDKAIIYTGAWSGVWHGDKGDRRKFGGQAAIAASGWVSLAGWNLCP